jgi:hypothetical protein
VVREACEHRLGLVLAGRAESQWSLPVACGGSGMVRAQNIAPAAFLGNAFQAMGVVKDLTGRADLKVSALPGVPSTFEAFKAVCDGPEIPGEVDRLVESPVLQAPPGGPPVRYDSMQRRLTSAIYRKRQAALQSDPTLTARDACRLRAVARPRAGAWLGAAPVPSQGLKFEPEDFITALKWWLGMEVSARCDVCPACGAEALDPLGDHAVCCAVGPSRIARHNLVNDAWCDVLGDVGLRHQKEVRLDPRSDHRPADTLVEGWTGTRACAQDWTVVHVLKSSFLSRGGASPADATREAEREKVSAIARSGVVLPENVDFLPMGVDTFGGFGPAASSAMRRVVALGRAGGALGCSGAGWGEDSVEFASQISVRLAVAGLKGVAHQILRRLPCV